MTILIDSNVPMYVVGGDHPHKAEAIRALEAALTGGQRLVTDAETLQEILHRYVAVSRMDALNAAFDLLLGLVDDVIPVTRAHVESAREFVEVSGRISARDAIHLAVMASEDITRIMSFDRGFDGWPGIERVC